MANKFTRHFAIRGAIAATKRFVTRSNLSTGSTALQKALTALLGIALLQMPTLSLADPPPGWNGEKFKPLEYIAGTGAPSSTPQGACASFAAVAGWNKNGYSMSITGPTANGWKCQRYFNGVIEPSWYTFAPGQARTSAGVPLKSGAPWSFPLADYLNDVFYCSTGGKFDRSVQWCVGGTSGLFNSDRDTSCRAGNPIATASGNKEHQENDFASAGFQIRREYNSKPASTSVVAPVGPLWSLQLGPSLELVGITPEQVKVRVGAGEVHRYEVGQGGAWQPIAGTQNTLVEVLSGGTRVGWRFVNQSDMTISQFSSDGRLQSIAKAGGGHTTFSYSDATTPPAVAALEGTLISATNERGRSVSFVSTIAGVSQIVIPGAQVDGPVGSPTSPIRFAYGEAVSLGSGVQNAQQLTSATYPDGFVRRYHYEDSRYPAGLTGISDAGVRLSSYVYDDEGRALTSTRFSGPSQPVDQWSISYGTGGQATITAPNGADSIVAALNQNGVNLQTSSSKPAGSGCAASTSSQSFDAQGNVILHDDFVGNRTCMAYDQGRNLEIIRVGGLDTSASCQTLLDVGATLPAGSLKASTLWHPDWRMAVKVAEPGRLTTNVYNGQPDPFNGNAIANCAPGTALLPDGKPIVVLCKKVEQATTDTNGSQGFAASLQAGVPNRVSQYTYNVWGQLLTAVDPLNNTTTNTYYLSTSADYTQGDLQQEQNAQGHITQYTKYNAHGQVLRMIDPNNVTTDYTYDLRQRLKTTSVGGQPPTVHDYYPNGLSQQITQPDGSWIGYEYDDAQRLRAVKDNLGNRIEYTLNASGLREEEKVKDPNGMLRRQLARVYDALGRVQQVTGRE